MMHRIHHHVHHKFRHVALAMTTFVLMAAMVAVTVVNAADLSSISDAVSRHSVDTDANHLIKFTTPSGAAEGETMVITFASEFDTSSITEDDVDIEDDGTDLTTDSACTAAEASVVMAADVMTITICVGGGGAIAAGSVVEIEVGTIATYNGTGLNQIQNPSSAGSYSVSMSGTFGDTGSAYVPVISDDRVMITAVVDDDDDGGTGPTDPCANDTDAPNITSVSAEDIDMNSADITWNTDESGTSSVEYGLTTAYELGSQALAGYSTSHSVPLSGLAGGTTYHYRVSSSDSCNNTNYSADQTFNTLGPLEITDVQVTDITQTGATIIWYTNKLSDSTVEYGVSTVYTGTMSSGADVTEHSLVLTGLNPNTLYHFRVGSETSDGESVYSGDYTFTTLAYEPPPNVTDFVADPGPGDTEITLTWVNPDYTDFDGVLIMRRDDDWPTGPTDGTEIFDGLAETALDTNVESGINYYYCAYAYNAYGYASGACDDALIPEIITISLKAIPEKRVPAEGNWGTDLTVGIHTTNDLAYEVVVGTSDEAGEATVDVFDVAYGTYNFSGKGLSHLTRVIETVDLVKDVATFVDFSQGNTVKLLAGDVNPTKDDFVNSLDISTLLGNLNAGDNTTDLNQDTLVNSLDINILLSNLNADGEL